MHEYLHCGGSRLYKIDLLGAYLWLDVEQLRKGLKRAATRLFSVKTVWVTLPHWVFGLLINTVAANYAQPQVVLTSWSITKILMVNLSIKNYQNFSNYIYFCNHMQGLVKHTSTLDFVMNDNENWQNDRFFHTIIFWYLFKGHSNFSGFFTLPQSNL